MTRCARQPNHTPFATGPLSFAKPTKPAGTPRAAAQTPTRAHSEPLWAEISSRPDLQAIPGAARLRRFGSPALRMGPINSTPTPGDRGHFCFNQTADFSVST